MRPSRERIKELQERFEVVNGRFFGLYKYKNLNWYLGKLVLQPFEEDEWFCFGDVCAWDIPKLQAKLVGNEVLTLGWKDLGKDEKHDPVFGDGGGPWLIITRDGVKFDKSEESLKKREAHATDHP